MGRSGASGERLKETQSINSSLKSLGDVISALVRPAPLTAMHVRMRTRSDALQAFARFRKWVPSCTACTNNGTNFLLDFTNVVPLKTGGSRADRWRGRYPRHALRARASTHPAYVVCAADAGQQ